MRHVLTNPSSQNRKVGMRSEHGGVHETSDVFGGNYKRLIVSSVPTFTCSSYSWSPDLLSSPVSLHHLHSRLLSFFSSAVIHPSFQVRQNKSQSRSRERLLESKHTHRKRRVVNYKTGRCGQKTEQ